MGVPTKDEAYLNLAFIFRAESNYKEAIECLTRALALDPKYREAKIVLKDIREALRLRKMKKQIESFDEQCDHISRLLKRDYVAAAAQQEKIYLKANPTNLNPYVWLSLGEALARCGRYKESQKLF